jgi:N-acetylmuramoyl-L-alanine amidase
MVDKMKLHELEAQDLLTGLLIGEAANQGFIGELAVACSVRNRVQDPHRWSNIYHDVILQHKQFSCFNDISRDEDIPHDIIFRYFTHLWMELWWRECWAASYLVIHNYVGDITNGANHYHVEPKSVVMTTGKIHEFKLPYWAEGKTPIFKWKDHWFYKL